MKKIGLIRGTAVALACLGMFVGQLARAAQPLVNDVALARGGVVTGKVVDRQGAAQAGVEVRVVQQGQVIATTQTDSQGEFQVADLRGGVYQIETTQGVGVYRLWADQTAPPAANDGVLVPQRLVLGTESPDGEFTPSETGEPRRVVSEATSAALRDMLTSVVVEGTGKRAQVEGYTVAGKTGTAWEVVGGHGYGTPGNRHLVTSFVGFLPATDPKLSIMVVIDDPHDPYATGGSLAAPLFQKVAAFAVGHLRIPPEGMAEPTTGERVRAEPVQPPTTPAPPTTAPTTTAAPATTAAAKRK